MSTDVKCLNWQFNHKIDGNGQWTTSIVANVFAMYKWIYCAFKYSLTSDWTQKHATTKSN